MIQTVLSDTLLHALGWTLVHSLWQAVLAALLALLLLPRLRKAVQRFWLAYSLLLLLPVASAFTFMWTYEPVPADTNTVFLVAPATETAAHADRIAPLAVVSWTGALDHWLEQNHSWIVLLWLSGFGFFLLRLAGGLYYVQQLRRREVFEPEAVWQHKLQELAGRIACSRPLRLLESALVNTPVTLGYFKPLVLLPVGLVNRLNPAEVEAILAHELAHIARRDWLLNLVQALIESLYYFHPAVWWLSEQARTERENCCDDFAVAITGDRLTYVKTLVTLQENLRSSHTTPALALGMAGSRNVLLDRVKRILQQQQHKSQVMEKIIATGILLAFIALWGVSASNGPIISKLAQMAEKPAAWFSSEEAETADYAAENDSIPKGKRRTQRIVSEDDGKRVEMELENGQITRLNVDGKEIDKDEFDTYRDVTESLLSEAPEPPLPPDAPMPPGTPTPPGFYFFRTPNAPDAPAAPDAPMAPFGMPGKITTEKDAAGNTILRIEQLGEPTEIVIKNGEVWIGDKKIETGESIDLQGVAPDARYFYFNGEPGKDMFFAMPEIAHDFRFEAPMPAEGFRFEMPKLAEFDFYGHDLSPEERAQMEKEMAEAMKEHKKEMERWEKEHKKEWKKHEKEWKKQQKDWEKHHKDLEKQRAEFEKSGFYERRRAEQEALREASLQQREAARQLTQERQSMAIEQRRMAEEHRAMAMADHERYDALSNAIKSELKKDGLITDTKKFSFQLNDEELSVNGKKQTAELHRKYLQLYENKTGEKFGKGNNISIEEEN